MVSGYLDSFCSTGSLNEMILDHAASSISNVKYIYLHSRVCCPSVAWGSFAASFLQNGREMSVVTSRYGMVKGVSIVPTFFLLIDLLLAVFISVLSEISLTWRSISDDLRFADLSMILISSLSLAESSWERYSSTELVPVATVSSCISPTIPSVIFSVAAAAAKRLGGRCWVDSYDFISRQSCTNVLMDNTLPGMGVLLAPPLPRLPRSALLAEVPREATPLGTAVPLIAWAVERPVIIDVISPALAGVGGLFMTKWALRLSNGGERVEKKHCLSYYLVFGEFFLSSSILLEVNAVGFFLLAKK